MPCYEITMQHSLESFEALSRMQYDLFCFNNRIARSVLALAAILFGLFHFSAWWGILAVAYGCYLTTSTYSSPNHTARKLADQVEQSGLGFPASRFLFYKTEVVICPIPDSDAERTTLAYRDIRRLGEDMNYFYLFRDEYGGYMIPKEALKDKTDSFRSFLEEAASQRFRMRTAPVIKLIRSLQRTHRSNL